MATLVILPKPGNSVESCVIQRWLKNVGDAIKIGEGLCEVETDKATVEVAAQDAGVLLAIYRPAGDDVPVQTAIAAIGAAGEAVPPAPAGAAVAPAPVTAAPAAAVPSPIVAAATAISGASPKARAEAASRGVDIATLSGSGPDGLIIARDVQAAPRATPAAQAAGIPAHATGTGIGGRVTTADASAPAPRAPLAAPLGAAGQDIPVKGIRKVIAERMRASLAGSAQLTLHTTAKAVALQGWRARYKAQAEGLGLPPVTVNDLLLFAVARTLLRFPALNAHWLGDKIRQLPAVHLGMAVDTERGLLVPVLRDAHAKSLAQIANEAKSLAKACQAGKAAPEHLSGSTFSITNVGALGIEQFTPVLNTPEVAILGVGAITLRPYQGENAVEFLPALGLSLTFDHQALDGAPAARFLQALVQAIEHIDLVLAA